MSKELVKQYIQNGFGINKNQFKSLNSNLKSTYIKYRFLRFIRGSNEYALFGFNNIEEFKNYALFGYELEMLDSIEDKVKYAEIYDNEVYNQNITPFQEGAFKITDDTRDEIIKYLGSNFDFTYRSGNSINKPWDNWPDDDY